MRNITRVIALAVLAGFAPLPAYASTICLQSHLIDHTSVPDTHTLLFHMKGGKVWRNTLTYPCPGLKMHGYIIKMSGTDQICSNMQTIRIIETHEVCMLGTFTPEPPPAPATPHS